jgi:uncharacterized protein (DUF58 family)
MNETRPVMRNERSPGTGASNKPSQARAGLQHLQGLWQKAARTSRDNELTLGLRNVYILPNRAGMLYATVVVAMLVAAVNYRLSLGYALTFLLASAALIGLLHTFRNLSGMVLRPGRSEPVHAGEPAEFSLIARNPRRVERFAIAVIAPGAARKEMLDLPAGAEHLFALTLPTRRRGWMTLPRLRLQTRYPLGIWTAWSYWHPPMQVLVYPALETPAAPLPENARAGTGPGEGAGEEDLAAIRPFQAGDSQVRVAWKAMARVASDTVLVKQFEGGEDGELWFDWAVLPGQLEVEARISRLARWVFDAERRALRYTLKLPGSVLGPDTGPAHLARCLQALALLET